MAQVVTFGEVMLRLQPEGYKRISQAEKYEATYGGAEVNVAVSLANYGIDAAFVSKIPNNAVADKFISEIKGLNVNTDCIARGGERLGIYFVEKGAAQRGSMVIYDRAYSSISDIDESDLDYDKIVEDIKWFHFTGITPAISKKTEKVLIKLLKLVKSRGATVSCDLNYRNKLWSKSEASAVMSNLMQYVDVLISNEEDIADVFAIHAEGSDIIGGTLSVDGYIKVAREVIDRFNLKKLAFTLRESISASVNNWSALLVDKHTHNLSRTYSINIVDRVGGGDSFGAGLIYGLISGISDKESLEFATAASALKHSIEGDYNRMSLSEVLKLKDGNATGRVVR